MKGRRKKTKVSTKEIKNLPVKMGEEERLVANLCGAKKISRWLVWPLLQDEAIFHTYIRIINS